MRSKADFHAVLYHFMGPLQMLHRKFACKRPVMEIALPACRITAYPYTEYLKTLSPRSQKMLRKEYDEANKAGKMVVFIRDEAERRLKSASVPIEEDD